MSTVTVTVDANSLADDALAVIGHLCGQLRVDTVRLAVETDRRAVAVVEAGGAGRICVK